MMMLQFSGIVLNFGINDINFGMDNTGDFQWITDDGRYDLIRNSVELSLDEKAKLLPNMTQT